MHVSGSLHVRENNFDFLRFVAAFLVLFSHCYPLTGHTGEEPFFRITGYVSGGELAVAIFFVMSGYLIASSWQNSNSLLAYAGKRAARILPALLLVVCLTVFALGPALTTLPVAEYFAASETWRYLLNVVFIARYHLPGVFTEAPYAGIVNGSLWTLPAEVLMYIGIALIGWFRGLNGRVVSVIVLISVAIYFLLPTLISEEALDMRRVRQLSLLGRLGAFFFAGTLIYLIRKQIPWRADIALGLTILLLAGFNTAWGEYALHLALPYLVLYLAQMKLGPLSGFGKYGDFSYGLYIFAFPIQQMVITQLDAGATVATVFVASAIPTLICAVLSWHFVESPALRWNQNRVARRSAAMNAASQG